MCISGVNVRSQIDQRDIVTLGNYLHIISNDLMFQIGKARSGDGYELEISADGYVPLFPLVKKVVDHAPKLPRWNIVAFRQSNPAIIEIGEIKVNPEEVLYFSTENTATHKYDVMLYYKDFEYENEEWQQALFVTLDNVLGEYNFATKIGTLNIMNIADADTRIRGDLRPIGEFKKELDKKRHD